MSKVRHNVTLNILIPGLIPEISLTELDTGHQICFHIAGMDLTGYTATIWVEKPSGLRVWNNCTVDGQRVIADITNQMLAEKGTCKGQIKLESTADSLVTPGDFILKVLCDLSGDGLESKNESTVFENMMADIMENMGIDATLTKTGYAADAAAVGEKFRQVSERIANQTGGSGLTTDLKSALKTYFTDMQTLFTQVAYKTDSNLSLTMIADAQAVVTALESSGESGGDDSGFGGEDSGDTGETEKTLSSIEATYTGGNVAVGTALTDLTGIVVIATYSDESTAVVTGYTLSGEIVEGANIITVSYGGKTTTFTVTGYVESTDEEWTVVCEIGENYETGYVKYDTGEVDASQTTYNASDFIEIPDGATSFSRDTTDTSILGVAWYDSEKTFICSSYGTTYQGNTQYGGGYSDDEGKVWIVIPSTAKYCKVTWKASNTYTSLTFKHNLLLNENVTPVYNKIYYYTTDPTNADNSVLNDDYLNCEGMAYAQIRPILRRVIKFYDENHADVSTVSIANNLGNNVVIPDGAKYIKFSTPINHNINSNQISYDGYGLIEFTETELTAW